MLCDIILAWRRRATAGSAPHAVLAGPNRRLQAMEHAAKERACITMFASQRKTCIAMQRRSTFASPWPARICASRRGRYVPRRADAASKEPRGGAAGGPGRAAGGGVRAGGAVRVAAAALRVRPRQPRPVLRPAGPAGRPPRIDCGAPESP